MEQLRLSRSREVLTPSVGADPLICVDTTSEHTQQVNKMENERTIVIKEKSEGGALKMAAIVAFVATSPFWFLLGVVVIGCFTGIVSDGGAWPWIALLVLSCLPAVRDRLSGKHDSKKLQDRINQLEHEAAETRLQLLHLQESIDFDTKLRVHQEQNSKVKNGTASQSRALEPVSRS